MNNSGNIKYFVVDNYLFFYEIGADKVVEVLRFLSAKSDWYSKLFSKATLMYR